MKLQHLHQRVRELLEEHVMSLGASTVARIHITASYFTGRDMIIGVLWLLCTCYCSSEQLGQIHMCRRTQEEHTHLPTSDNEIACCAIRISASSGLERRSWRSIIRPPVISTGTSQTPAMVRVCFCVASMK